MTGDGDPRVRGGDDHLHGRRRGRFGLDQARSLHGQAAYGAGDADLRLDDYAALTRPAADRHPVGFTLAPRSRPVGGFGRFWIIFRWSTTRMVQLQISGDRLPMGAQRARKPPL